MATRDKQESLCLGKERRTKIATENWQRTWTASHDQFPSNSQCRALLLKLDFTVTMAVPRPVGPLFTQTERACIPTSHC